MQSLQGKMTIFFYHFHLAKIRNMTLLPVAMGFSQPTPDIFTLWVHQPPLLSAHIQPIPQGHCWRLTSQTVCDTEHAIAATTESLMTG